MIFFKKPFNGPHYATRFIGGTILKDSNKLVYEKRKVLIQHLVS